MKSTKIPNIRKLLWDLVYYYLENYPQSKNLFSKDIGIEFLKKLSQNKQISQFQWKCETTNGVHDLLELYCNNFIIKICNFNIKEIQKKTKNGKFTQDFIHSSELKSFFNQQFKFLEEDIILSEKFEYKILIPAFRVIFPTNNKEIILDVNHLIRDISEDDFPYGNSSEICDFKEPPPSWFGYTRHSQFRLANTSFEITLIKKKKLSYDSPYERDKPPYYPFQNIPYCEFAEKVRSIYDFFFCYKPDLDFPPFTLNDRYYILLPPFSQVYDYVCKFLTSEFAPPTGFLDLKKPNILKEWKDCWKKNYNNFYKTYFTITPSSAKTEIFRYTLDVLRMYKNIPYVRMRNFLLVSTFEGLLYKDSIKKTLKVTGKGEPVAKTFIEVCEDQNQYWIYLFNKKFIPGTSFNKMQYNQDLEKFLISTYQYRNNIAHPGHYITPNYEPQYLYQHVDANKFNEHLAFLIYRWFPKFLKYLIKIWLNNNFKSEIDWYQYLDNLFP